MFESFYALYIILIISGTVLCTFSTYKDVTRNNMVSFGTAFAWVCLASTFTEIESKLFINKDILHVVTLESLLSYCFILIASFALCNVPLIKFKRYGETDTK